MFFTESKRQEIVTEIAKKLSDDISNVSEQMEQQADQYMKFAASIEQANEHQLRQINIRYEETKRLVETLESKIADLTSTIADHEERYRQIIRNPALDTIVDSATLGYCAVGHKIVNVGSGTRVMFEFDYDDKFLAWVREQGYPGDDDSAVHAFIAQTFTQSLHEEEPNG